MTCFMVSDTRSSRLSPLSFLFFSFPFFAFSFLFTHRIFIAGVKIFFWTTKEGKIVFGDFDDHVFIKRDHVFIKRDHVLIKRDHVSIKRDHVIVRDKRSTIAILQQLQSGIVVLSLTLSISLL